MATKGRIEQHALPVPVAEPAPRLEVVEPISYPDSDGHFLPDNPLQANAVMELRISLREHFHDDPDVVVEGDMFIYYARGEADERRVRGKRVGKYVAPDLFVVLDHDLGGRSTYMFWVEGKPPDFALEVISPSSEVRNRVAKKELYERIGIGEYFVFQPNPERRGPRLVGYALEGSRYRELGPDPALSPGAGSVRSEALGVSFRPEGAFLRVRNVRTGKDYRWQREQVTKSRRDVEARRQAEQRADRKTQEAAREAEARRQADERADREAKERAREAAARRQADERADRKTQEAARQAEARRRAEARIAILEARLARRGQ